jgi:nitroreductase
MDVYEAIRLRRSVRAFSPKPVDRETLARIFSAVRLAPSARNQQEWRFVAVTGQVMRGRLAREAAGQPFLCEAPVVLACCAETDGRVMRCGQPCYPIDTAIAMDHLSLAAAAEGLGTCWIGSFDEGIVKSLLGIPEAVRVVGLMPLGHPADPAPVEKKRLEVSVFLHDERW